MTWGSDLTIGIEEELLLVDPNTLAPVDSAEEVVRRAAAAGIDTEAHAHVVELRGDPADDAAAAVASLRVLRERLRGTGAAFVGCGLHPQAELFDARLTESDRYSTVLDAMRGLIGRTPECALHVHVGAPDPETAIRIQNGLRAHVPLLTALAANSPFWFGRDSGLASARWSIVRGYPRHRIPPFFEDYAHYEDVMAEARAFGDLPDYTYVWWDVRPHPRLGTVEVRELDSQGDLVFVQALAESVHTLARRAAEDPNPPALTAEALAESSYRAARDGVNATLLYDGRMRPVSELARELLGGRALEALVEAGGGAGRRRAAFERGGMRAMLEEMVGETVA